MEQLQQVPVAVGLPVIRAWTDHAWPIGESDLTALAEELGWTVSHEDARLFTTPWRLEDDDAMVMRDASGVSSVQFLLARAADGTGDAHAVFDAYVAALTDALGKPRRSTHRGVRGADWQLPNGVALAVHHLEDLVNVDILSPALNRAVETGEE